MSCNKIIDIKNMQKRMIFFLVFFFTLLQLYSHCVQQCYLISLQKVYEISRKVLPNDLVPSLHDTINMARLKVFGERVFCTIFLHFQIWSLPWKYYPTLSPQYSILLLYYKKSVVLPQFNSPENCHFKVCLFYAYFL